MPFAPLEFKLFKINTLNLDTYYSTLLGRYLVEKSHDEGSSTGQQTSLDVLIARTNQVIRCKTDRETQREVFNQLANELRQIPKDDDEKIRQGTLFLLGALIHRYFRLIKEYDDYNSYISWTMWTCNVTDCKLFQAIRKALKLKDLELVKKSFRTEDLKVLDAVTIVKALEVFRDNMFLKDESKTPRYMKYPHFAKDEHFEKYLKDIIEEYSDKGKSFLLGFCAISFIQSLARELEREQQQLAADIKKWCKALAQEYKDFSSFRALDPQTIKASIIKNVESKTSVEIIFELFNTPFIQDGLNTTDHSNFFVKMDECYDNTASYILFGGYILLLHQSKGFDSNLLFVLQKALGLERSLEELTYIDRLNGIKFLNKFLGYGPRALDFEFFEEKDKMKEKEKMTGKEEMNTAIARAEKEITLLIPKSVEHIGLQT